MITEVVQMIGVKRILDFDPHLLVEQEKVDIIQIRSVVGFEKGVVAATAD